MRKSTLLVFFLLGIVLHGQNAFKKNFGEAADYYNNDDYSKAIEKFDAAIAAGDQAENNYRLADAYIFRGYCKSKLNKHKAGIKDMDEGIRLKPEYGKGYQLKSELLLSLKDYDACVNTCDAGLKWKPTDQSLLVNKWQALEGLKKYEEAKNSLRILLSVNPRNIDALRFIGSTCINQHQWDSAVIYFEKAININPLDFMSYYDRGISKSYLKDTAGAQADIEKAMQLDTATKFVGYNNLGFFLKLEQKKYEEAMVFFNKAIELKPDFAYAYSNRGFCKIQLGDLSGAYKDLMKSLEMDNTNSYAHKNLGIYYLKKGSTKKACEAFKKALDLGYASKYDDEVDKLLSENCP